MAMHSKIFERIATRAPDYDYIAADNIHLFLMDFFRRNGYAPKERINPAGKNFASFDSRFLNKLPHMDEIFFSHRVIDPAILFWNPMTDKSLPDTKTCYERAGLKDDVAHTAVDDARGIVRLLRAKFCATQG